MIPPSGLQKVPKTLAAAAAAVIDLLEELIATDLTLLTDGGTYACLSTVRRWWQPLPYPKSLADELGGLRSKIVAAITLRARLGQRSDELSQRLVASVDDPRVARTLLREVAAANPGIAADIRLWLSGDSRAATNSSAADALRSVESQTFLTRFAERLADIWRREDQGERLDSPGDRAFLELARGQGLERDGHVGDLVEYNPSVHRTLTGQPPVEPYSKIVVPGVLRSQSGGPREFIVPAILS
jgi:hypothetical protein